MPCPFCPGKLRQVYTRQIEGRTKRVRECDHCAERFDTWEAIRFEPAIALPVTLPDNTTQI